MPVHITQAHATKVNQPGRIYDTHRGLHLWVKSDKAKYWIYRNAKDGKRQCSPVQLRRFRKVSTAQASPLLVCFAYELAHPPLPPLCTHTHTHTHTHTQLGINHTDDPEKLTEAERSRIVRLDLDPETLTWQVCGFRGARGGG